MAVQKQRKKEKIFAESGNIFNGKLQGNALSLL